jgi:hypothetical protein
MAKRLVLRDETGKPQSLVQVLEDQTERLATQAELDQARNFLDVVIDPTAICLSAEKCRSSGLVQSWLRRRFR